ncbi:hypothetical protein [Paraliobacillus sp. JSM ZJ581]|uniref:hypothetical protein n=1 Tax=Paraliobacillus sp. JSM ZJ581 TaxID=3342118 RepID=UPI0035A95CC0
MRKQKKIFFLLIVIILAPSVFYLLRQSTQIVSTRAIFSWSSEEITYNKKQLVNDLVTYDFDRLFQSISSDVKNQEVISFVTELTNQNIDVYKLSGTPEWALDPSGTGMIEQLDQIIKINRQLPKKNHIKGLVIDVEPYTLDHFEWEDKFVQKSYISAMKKLYQEAKQEGLELVVVVPYFYDTKGYKDVLNTFIHEASSEIAVMNYYRNHEIEHLSFEAKEAKKADKPLTTIYEFKQPGQHDLNDINTYFNKGRSAAVENAKQLIQHYNNQTIHIAYHDYHAFREVIENE